MEMESVYALCTRLKGKAITKGGTEQQPIPVLAPSGAWKVLLLFTTAEAMVEETLGRFLQKIVRPSNCAFKRRLDEFGICREVSLLNCERAAVEKYRDVVAAWLRMQTLKVKPAQKSTPQILRPSICPSTHGPRSLNIVRQARAAKAKAAARRLKFLEAKCTREPKARKPCKERMRLPVNDMFLCLVRPNPGARKSTGTRGAPGGQT